MHWHIYMDQTDYWVIVAIVLLSIFGILMVYSSTYSDPNTAFYTSKQLIWILLGLICFAIIIGYDYHTWLRYAWWLYFGNIILLLAVILIGRQAGGAVRWLSIGGFHFQPSEISKLVLILTLTRFVSDMDDRIKQWTTILAAFIIIGIPMILIFKQPALGSSLVCLPILYSILFVSGARIKHLLIPVIAGIIISPIGFIFLKNYQKNRILTFLDPERDPLGAGYNVIQSKIAVGSGKFFGRGWLKGSQTQLDFLPENHTDFAFSNFAEQFGFIGALIILGLFGFVLVRMLIWTKTTKDRQGIYLIAGIVSVLLTHLLINVGMALGIMPVTGLPLPFISYGGSSYIVFMTAMGIAINIHQRRYTY